MIKIGFSTLDTSPLSKVIRWFTKSEASHAWLLLEDAFYGESMVLEATEVGFRLIPYERFLKNNDVVALLAPKHPIEPGMPEAVRWIGTPYDFAGLFGNFVVSVGRWFKKKWHNPAGPSRAMFCSEAVCRVMQAAKYPGVEGWDPETTTPQDLLELLRSEV